LILDRIRSAIAAELTEPRAPSRYLNFGAMAPNARSQPRTETIEQFRTAMLRALPIVGSSNLWMTSGALRN
jgi:hypothetical protein